MTSPYTEGLVVTGMNREFKNVQFKIKKLLSCAVLYNVHYVYIILSFHFSRQEKNYLKNCIFNSREKFSNAFFFNFRAIQIQIDGKNNAEFAVFFSGPICKLPTKIAQKEGKA